jgi:predicted MFS family arabinose efflux permease
MDVGIGIGSVVQAMGVEAYGFDAAFGLTAAFTLAAVAAYWAAKSGPAQARKRPGNTPYFS